MKTLAWKGHFMMTHVARVMRSDDDSSIAHTRCWAAGPGRRRRAELILVKNRTGAIGTVKLRFFEEYCLFEERL